MVRSDFHIQLNQNGRVSDWGLMCLSVGRELMSNNKYINADPMVQCAKDYAAEWHRSAGQTYDGAPYTKHLSMVVAVARSYIHYVNENDQCNVLAACWCHDVIEDTPVTREQLAAVTNRQVAEIVFAVSNESGSTRYERCMRTYHKIRSNNMALFVKLADRIANTTNSRHAAPVMYAKYRNEYPVFKHYLQAESNSYYDMWKELANVTGK